MRATCAVDGCERTAFGRGLCSPHYQKARYHGELPPEPPIKQCLRCGTEFQSRKWNAAYCSRACVDGARYDRTRRAPARDVECARCGRIVTSTRSDMRFCSDACSQAHRNAAVAARNIAAKVAAPRYCPACDKQIDPSLPRSRVYCDGECKRAMRRAATYGLTRDELHALIAQHDRCAICGGSDWGKKGPQVDHDHATGAVRGVLCSNCNTGLGHFKDDAALLRRAVKYLSR